MITKSGDIIPVVEKVIQGSNNIPMPECDYVISGLHLKANNMEESRIYKFILALKILQIDGIGPEIANKVGTIVDYDIIELFNPLHKPAICSMLGGSKIWERFEKFYQIKTIYLNTLIELLQFNRCGKVYSEKFAKIITKQIVDTTGIEKEVLNIVCRGDGFMRIKNSMDILRKYGEMAKTVGGHGGMDFIMDSRLVYCLQNGLPLDIDVYDLAEWCCLAELGALSMDNNCAPVAIPDFTRGFWNLQKGYSHAYATREDEETALKTAQAFTKELKERGAREE